MNRNDRSITDLTTGVDLPQHQMLKVLFERSGLKRNDWHEKAQQLVGRSLGSPTKLSDIFNGKSRSLPMRDIVPYIQVLGMRKSETDYYIAEFFKAYCDESLHQYVQSKSKSEQLLLLEQKLKIKDFELNRLVRQIGLLQHSQKHKASLSSAKLSTNQSQSWTLETLSSNEAHVIDVGYSESDPEDFKAIMAQCTDQYKTELERSKMESAEFNSFGQKQADIYQDAMIHGDLQPYVEWFLLLTIVKENYHDQKLCQNLALFIPANFENVFLSNSADASEFPIPVFRTQFEVAAGMLTQYKKEYEEEFNEVLQERLSRESDGRVERQFIIPVVDDEYIRKSQLNYKFERYLRTELGGLGSVPFDIKFLRFDDNEIYQTVDLLFKEYGRFKALGLRFSCSLDELCNMQNPPVSLATLTNEARLTKLLAVIEAKSEDVCQRYGIENPIKHIICHPDYPNFIQSSRQRRAAAPSWMDRLTNKNKPS